MISVRTLTWSRSMINSLFFLKSKWKPRMSSSTSKPITASRGLRAFHQYQKINTHKKRRMKNPQTLSTLMITKSLTPAKFKLISRENLRTRKSLNRMKIGALYQAHLRTRAQVGRIKRSSKNPRTIIVIWNKSEIIGFSWTKSETTTRTHQLVNRTNLMRPTKPTKTIALIPRVRAMLTMIQYTARRIHSRLALLHQRREPKNSRTISTTRLWPEPMKMTKHPLLRWTQVGWIPQVAASHLLRPLRSWSKLKINNLKQTRQIRLLKVLRTILVAKSLWLPRHRKTKADNWNQLNLFQKLM